MRDIRHAPEPPFPVEWSSAAMDQIRAAATEGFFALPHGGLEIGGVLWGTRANGGMRIMAACPLECEHASGPTFRLSPNDHARLAAMLANGPEGCEPLGWYRSRTRGEICFSPGDLEIHDRYFAEPWQLALMVQPHAIDPLGMEYFFEVGQAPCRAQGTPASQAACAGSELFQEMAPPGCSCLGPGCRGLGLPRWIDPRAGRPSGRAVVGSLRSPWPIADPV